MAGYYEKRGIELTDNTKKQADLPEGCIAFQNNHGTAPGLAIEGKGKIVIMLPGPPSEMIPMFDNSAVPYLLKYSGKTIISSTVHFFGIGESLLEPECMSTCWPTVIPLWPPMPKTARFRFGSPPPPTRKRRPRQ